MHKNNNNLNNINIEFGIDVDIDNNNNDINKIMCIDEDVLKDLSQKKNIFYNFEERNINESTYTNYENKKEKKNKNTISNDITNYDTNKLEENNENDGILYLKNINDESDLDYVKNEKLKDFY